MKIRFLHAIKMYINWNRTKDLIYCIYILMATFKVHWASTVKCSCRDKRLRDLMFESHATVCVEECKILVSLAFANNHIVFCWRFARARKNNCFAPISMFFSLFTSCTYNSIEWPSFDPNLSKTFEFTELQTFRSKKYERVFFLTVSDFCSLPSEHFRFRIQIYFYSF